MQEVLSQGKRAERLPGPLTLLGCSALDESRWASPVVFRANILPPYLEGFGIVKVWDALPRARADGALRRRSGARRTGLAIEPEAPVAAARFAKHNMLAWFGGMLVRCNAECGEEQVRKLRYESGRGCEG